VAISNRYVSTLI